MHSSIQRSSNGPLAAVETSLCDKYLGLIDAHGILNRCCRSALDGVTAASWPDKFRSQPFDWLRRLANHQATFSKLALEKFAAAQRQEVLEIAEINMRATRLLSEEALTFAIRQQGDVDSTAVNLAKLQSIVTTARSSSTDDRYVLLINVLATLRHLFAEALQCARNASLERYPGVAPFFELTDQVRNQMDFAEAALQTFITAQQPEVLDAAHANLLAARVHTLSAINFAIQKVGFRAFIDFTQSEIEKLLDQGQWVIITSQTGLSSRTLYIVP